MNNVKLVQQGYDYWAEGDIHLLTGLFHPDIFWEDCNGFPFIQGNGAFRGITAIVDGALSHISDQYDGFYIDIQELFSVGEKVVMVGYYKGVLKKRTRPFKANVTHVWSIRDNKIFHFFQAVDTAAIFLPATE